MVLFSLAGQFIETVIYRGGFFFMEKSFDFSYWLASVLYYKYNPRVTEVELLRIEMKDLKREIKELKNKDNINVNTI